MKKVQWGFIFVIGFYLYAVPGFSQHQTIKIIELNNDDEYVLIKNEGKSAINLNGWMLHDHDYGKATVYSYTFGDFQLKGGEIVQMQSGKGDFQKLPIVDHYIRWSERNVWNNGCDIAYLQDENGTFIDEKHNGNTVRDKKKDNCR